MSRKNISRYARAVAITSYLFNAFAHALTCVAGLAPSTPITDFTIDSGVGTALHSKTGLMWDACSYGQTSATCTGTATTYNWQQAFVAVAAANASNYKGYADWRLRRRRRPAASYTSSRFQCMWRWFVRKNTRPT